MYPKLKLRRTDNIVILVASDVLTLTLPEGKSGEKLYKQIEGLVRKLNSGLLSKQKEIKTREKVLELMMPEKKKVGKSKDANDEAYELAGSLDHKRKKKMKRVATVHKEFEYDSKGYTYLKGFSVPIPNDLADALLDAHYNKNSKYTVQSLVNFWQWALMNPNEFARNDLFKWFSTGNFSITDSGMVVAYRCVAFKRRGHSSELDKFVEKAFIKVKSWKKSPKNYGVIYEDGDYKLIDLKKDNNNVWIDKSHFEGFLAELYADKDTNEAGDIYTDNHTKKMVIKIGEEVRMHREDCDEDRETQCSRGLHFMSKKYNLRLGDEKLIVLINPMDIVAFPSYDQSKGRTCAYFPVAKALLDDNGDLEEFEGGTYDFEYANYGKERLDELFNNYSLKDLQKSGAISEDITKKDVAFMRDSIAKLLKDKVINVC